SEVRVDLDRRAGIVCRGRPGPPRAARPAGRARRRPCRSQLYEAHRANPAAQLRELPPPERRGADAAGELRRRAAVGARDQAATGMGPRAGVMPPWYVEKNIGIQKFHNDPSLSDDEIATIAKWADSGAPRGNPADMPPAKVYADERAWAIGTPDLIIKMQELEVKGDAPDWWGEIPSVPTGLTEDRYVAALEIREVNDVESHSGLNRATVGGRFVFHHMIWRTQVIDPTKDNSQDPLSFILDEEAVNWP